MFNAFFDTVVDYLGQDFFSSLLWVSLIVSAAAVTALLLTALFYSRKDDRTAAVQRVLDVTLSLSKVFAGVALTVILLISLKAQYADFNQIYGRVTETNYEAVKSIWGSPHDQNNLDVKHYVEEEQIIEQIRAEDRMLEGQGIPAEVERRFRKKVTRELRQESIVENDHRVTINMNYRKKGSAYYTTYDNEAEFNYVVENKSDKTTNAKFTFRLPILQGLVHEIEITVDGRDFMDKVNVESRVISWELEMAPSQKNKVRIAYKSRGIDYWAFRVWGMEALNNFRLQIIIPGYDVENNPMGCMTPTKVIHDEKGTVLEWKLERAVTNLGMGVILPQHPQPGHYESALLKASPIALFLLVVLIVITRSLLSVKMALLPVMLLGFAHERFFSLLAYFRAVDMPISLSLIVSGGLLVGAVLVFLIKYGDSHRVAWLQTLLFALLTLGYSLCVIETEHTALLLQILYVFMLLLVMAMAVISRRADQSK